ncbi:MAG: T9SS type A sorting domain-containing protein [Chlorobi bacterium]|nr:T9SS type A sorting domain-containing protein [Chlorobiota bacterium]
MNYKHSGANAITNTIWITDTIISFDTAIIFNKVVLQSHDNPDYFIKNSGQFLQKTMFIKGDGVFKFANPWSFVIKSKAKIGDTWFFNSDDGLIATVDTIIETETFNISDSVKTIKLEKNGVSLEKFIKLSKNFGIIEFPDFSDTGKYVLSGLQNDTLGEQIADFWDFYDFNIDDVFQYYHYSRDPSMGEEETKIEKYTIISKEVDDSSFHYVVEGIKKGSVFNYFNHETYTYVLTFVRNQNYNYNAFHFSNRYPNEFLRMPDCYHNESADGHVYTTITVGKNSRDLRTKRMGLTMNQENGKLFYFEKLGSDSLVRIHTQYEWDTYGLHGITATESLGVTHYRYEWWEGENIYYLQGYVKDGDTVGKITDDDILLSTKYPEKHPDKSYRIFPVPAGDMFYIKWENPLMINWEFRLFSIDGKQVMVYKGNQKKVNLNCSYLSPGIYFYKIISGNYFSSGKLIKK